GARDVAGRGRAAGGPSGRGHRARPAPSARRRGGPPGARAERVARRGGPAGGSLLGRGAPPQAGRRPAPRAVPARRRSVRGLMSRALRALAAAVVLLVSGAPPAAAAPPARVLAGATSVTVSLPDDTPLGGYGGFPRRAWLPDLIGRYPDTFWFRPSTGEHDPIKVRALVLEAGG